MSQQPLAFDESVTDAVDCALAQLEDAAAVEDWLREEFEPGGESGRVEEALAYLRYRREGET